MIGILGKQLEANDAGERWELVGGVWMGQVMHLFGPCEDLGFNFEYVGKLL